MELGHLSTPFNTPSPSLSVLPVTTGADLGASVCGCAAGAFGTAGALGVAATAGASGVAGTVGALGAAGTSGSAGFSVFSCGTDGLAGGRTMGLCVPPKRVTNDNENEPTSLS